MFAVTRTRTAVGLLAAAAVAAPSAAAMPTDSGPQAAIAAGATDATGGYEFTPASTPPPQPAAPRIVEVHTSSGFDWGDAGLGAAAMLSALGVGAGVAVAARRGRPTIG